MKPVYVYLTDNHSVLEISENHTIINNTVLVRHPPPYVKFGYDTYLIWSFSKEEIVKKIKKVNKSEIKFCQVKILEYAEKIIKLRNRKTKTIKFHDKQ